MGLYRWEGLFLGYWISMPFMHTFNITIWRRLRDVCNIRWCRKKLKNVQKVVFLMKPPFQVYFLLICRSLYFSKKSDVTVWWNFCHKCDMIATALTTASCKESLMQFLFSYCIANSGTNKEQLQLAIFTKNFTTNFTNFY